MPWIRVWLHFVWSTHQREPLLTDNVRSRVFEHIKVNARKKGIFIDTLGGHLDHVHCLVSLGANQSIEQIMQLLKGESSFWINKNKLTQSKFSWQDDYWAVSVSESHLKALRNYIFNQEDHHRKEAFSKEIEDFMNKYGWKLVSENNHQ